MDNFTYIRELPEKNYSPIVALAMEWTAKRIDQLIGGNLRRLRDARGLSQGEIAALSGTEKTKISAYENGHEGIGKDVMTRLCNALKVRPFDFYFEATVPAIADPEEKQQISLFREARALGVAEDLARYGSYRVGEAKRERVAGGKESPDDRIKRKLAALKPLEPGRDRRTGRERRTPKKSSA